MLRERVPNGRCSKGKQSEAHFWSNIRHNEEILVGGSVSVAVTVFVAVYVSEAEFDHVSDSACFCCCFHVSDVVHGRVRVHVQ